MQLSLPLLRTPEQAAKRKTLAVLLGLVFIEGFLASLIGEDSPNARAFTIGCLLVNAVVVMRWFFLDAKEQGFHLTKMWILMLVGFGIFAMPFYFVRTRGRKCFPPLALFLVFACLFFIAAFGGGYLAYYTQMLQYE